MVLTARQQSGLALEKPVHNFLTQRMKLKAESNDFSKSGYPCSIGLRVDHVTEDLLIEDTNPKKTTWFKDPDIMQKFNHFLERDPEHKLTWVMITSFDNWSKKVKQWLIDHAVTVIELGFTVGKYDFGKAIKALFNSKLYSIIKPKYTQFALKVSKKGKLTVNKPKNKRRFFSSLSNNSVFNANKNKHQSKSNSLYPHETGSTDNSMSEDKKEIIRENFELLGNGINILTDKKNFKLGMRLD